MKLSDWMKEQACNDKALGVRLGVNRATISRIRRGLNRPSWELATRIKQTTGNAVTADDFLLDRQSLRKRSEAAE